MYALTSAVTAIPPLARASSSATSATASASPPDPPNSSGVARPSTPADPSCFHSSAGNSPAASAPSTSGRTCRSTNDRALAWKSRCTSSSSQLMTPPTAGGTVCGGLAHSPGRPSRPTGRSGYYSLIDGPRGQPVWTGAARPERRGGAGDRHRDQPRGRPARPDHVPLGGDLQPAGLPCHLDERDRRRRRPVETDALPLFPEQGGAARPHLLRRARRERGHGRADGRGGGHPAGGDPRPGGLPGGLHLREQGAADGLLRGGARATAGAGRGAPDTSPGLRAAVHGRARASPGATPL